MPTLINDINHKIEQFQIATAQSVAVAISYLEAEEFVVSNAVKSFIADQPVVALAVAA